MTPHARHNFGYLFGQLSEFWDGKGKVFIRKKCKLFNNVILLTIPE